MKHFYIILNPYKSGAVEMAEKISQYLESRGCICHMPERMEKADGDHTGYRYTCLFYTSLANTGCHMLHSL